MNHTDMGCLRKVCGSSTTGTAAPSTMGEKETSLDRADKRSPFFDLKTGSVQSHDSTQNHPETKKFA